MKPTILLLLLLLFDLAFSRKIISPNTPTHRRFSNEPKVWLQNWEVINDYQSDPFDSDPRFKTLHVFENEFISKNGSDYIIFDRVLQVVFACKAKYPVKWTAPFSEQMLRLSSYEVLTTDLRSSVFNPHSQGKPHNRYFVTVFYLTIAQSKFLSANITCESVDGQHDRKTSIYLFRRGENVIENERKTIDVPLDYKPTKNDDNFILPCRPASPHLGVILEKQGPDKSFAEIKAPPKYLIFDPKLGFTMNNRLLGSQSFGLYRCRVNETNAGDNDGVVYVNVTSDDHGAIPKETEEEFRFILSKEGNATLYQDGRFLWCCSGVPGRHPVTLSESCNEASQCDLMKSILMEKAKNLEEFGRSDEFQSDPVPPERDDCSVIYLATTWTSSLVHCRGGNLQYQQHYTLAFEPRMQNIEERVEMGNTSEQKHFMRHVTADALQTLPVDRKVFISVGQLETPAYTEYETYEPRKFQQLTGLTNWQLLGNTYPMIPHSIGIWEFDRNYYYSGEKLIIACISLPLLYSNGAQFRINYKNGTSASLAPVNHENAYWDFEGGAFFNDGHGAVAINHCLSNEITATLEIESVECYVPQWNTTDWDVLKYDLDIRTAVLPEVEVDKESVYFQLMEENAKISFNVKGGQPVPRIMYVFKDGKIIKGGVIIRDSHNEITLQGANAYDYDWILKLNVNVTIEETMMEAGGGKNATVYAVSLVFPNATHEMQGLYSCTVENIKGNVTQAIHVYVTAGRGNRSVTILLSCTVVVLGLLLGVIGVWHKCQHKTIQSLRFGISRL